MSCLTFHILFERQIASHELRGVIYLISYIDEADYFEIIMKSNLPSILLPLLPAKKLTNHSLISEHIPP
jgi:hypothetical protein